MRILFIADYFGLDRASGTKRANVFARCWAADGGADVDVVTARKPHVALNPPESLTLPDRVRERRLFWCDVIGWQASLRSWLKGKGSGDSGAGGAPAGNGESAATPKKAPLWKRPLRFVSDLMTMPDRHAMWAPWALLRCLFIRKPDIVVATAPAFVNLAVGAFVSRRRGVPFVADMRDPWLTNPFRPHRTGRLGALDRRLERYALEAAAEIWVTTERLETELLERTDLDVKDRIRVLPNGYDEEEWKPIQPTPRSGDEIRILHTGSLYGVRSPVPFLEDLDAVHGELDADLWRRVRVSFVGGMDAENRGRIDRLALENVAVEGSVPARQALQRQMDSDLLLLIGHATSEPTSQIPLKLYEYIRAGKRQLAYFQKESAVADVAAAHPELQILLADLDDAKSRRELLRRVLEEAATGRVELPEDAVRRFDRDAIAREAFDRLRTLSGRES